MCADCLDIGGIKQARLWRRQRRVETLALLRVVGDGFQLIRDRSCDGGGQNLGQDRIRKEAAELCSEEADEWAKVVARRLDLVFIGRGS